MLNLCLWIGNICNGLLLSNASIAILQKKKKKKKKLTRMRLQENHGLQNPTWKWGGGGKPYLANGL